MSTLGETGSFEAKAHRYHIEALRFTGQYKPLSFVYNALTPAITKR